MIPPKKTTAKAVKRRNRVTAVTVRPSPLSKTRAILRLGPVAIPVALGRGGRSVLKREGDGATPVATMRLLYGYVRRDKFVSMRSVLPLIPTPKNLGWCDAPRHGAYNCPVRLPFAASHETMRRADSLYDVVLVMDWNVTRRMRGAGSAIFMHLARPGYQPTEGCIALDRKAMARLLAAVDRHTVIRVV